MRKILISVALGAATVTGAVAVPAAAQAQRSWQHPNGPTRGQINALLGDLGRAEQRINRSLQRRIISPREATGLRREATSIRFQLNRAARNGIGGREFASLRFQVNRLEQRVTMERRDWDRRRG
jgi:hypothetical protein